MDKIFSENIKGGVKTTVFMPLDISKTKVPLIMGPLSKEAEERFFDDNYWDEFLGTDNSNKEE